MIDPIPSPVYWGAIALLVALSTVQQIRVLGVKEDLANVQAERATETAQRERTARAHTEAISAIQSKHAADQQLKENEYVTKLAKLEEDRRMGDAVAVRLRGQLAAYATVGRTPGETDAVALQRTGDRLRSVSGLLSEGIELLEEGRGLVQTRDAQVEHLLDQIRIDRAACQAPAL